jgi:parvulin-like peptidyl-prolyl isomerase
MPSRAELQALVDDFVNEEVDYREAVAMGLDADDTIVRRRMRQKLEFLAEDADATEEPSEADLSAWLKLHADEYHIPGRVAIRQVLASGDERGPKAAADANLILAKLKTGVDPASVGDPSMLPAAMPLTSEQGIAALFGDDFARTVFKQEGEGWFGPVSSPFGQHLVLVMEREPGRDATLEDEHNRLRADWIEAKRSKKRDDFQARLRGRYQVKVNWPEPYLSQPAPTADELAREHAKRPVLDNVSGE